MAVVARFQALLYIAFAVVALPFSTAALLFSYASLLLVPKHNVRRRIRRSPGFKPKKVLVIGVGSPSGLRIARAFHDTGHTVVGVDHEPQGIPIPARWSSALFRFYEIKAPLQKEFLAEIRREIAAVAAKENTILCIDCSEDPSLSAQWRNVVLRNKNCISFIPSLDDAEHLSSQTSFLSFARGHELPVPEKYQVTSRHDIHKVLGRSVGRRQYTLNAVKGENATWPRSRTVFPRRTLSQTYNEVSRVKIAKDVPWLLEQYTEGLERYRTFSIVVKGEVQAFASAISVDSGYEQPIVQTSILSQALLRCVKNIVGKLDPEFTSHLCVDFLVDEKATDKGVEKSVMPIDARARVESTALLFHGIHGSIDLVRAYSSAFAPVTNGVSKGYVLSQEAIIDDSVLRPTGLEKGVYSFGNDVIRLFFKPTFQLLTFQITPAHFGRSFVMLLNHISFWQECTYDFKDPFPFWYLYQVYLPVMLFLFVLRVNGDKQGLNFKGMIE